MTEKECVWRTMEQVATDLGCSPSDFVRVENTLVTPVLAEGRRRFLREKDFFRIACFGRGAVVAAHGDIAGWCRGFIAGCEGTRCFDSEGIYQINEELAKHGMRLGYFSEYYLPDPITRRVSLPELEVRWYEMDEIPALYVDDRFHCALMYSVEGLRRDVLAVAALDGGVVVGIAAASDDSAEFWQVGVDVIPECRGRGIATGLVSSLTDEILRRGKVPYYGTWWSNIASGKVALGSGFQPVWVEMSAVELLNIVGSRQ